MKQWTDSSEGTPIFRLRLGDSSALSVTWRVYSPPALIPKTREWCPRRRVGVHLFETKSSSDLRFILTLLKIVDVGLFFRSSFSARKLAALALSLCFITGCEGKAHGIAGRWRVGSDPNAMIWEFSSNGSILIGANRGRYSFGDNNRIKIETSFATSVYQIEISGDKMTLKEPSGSKLVLTKVVK